jgi:hypothetical protein
MTAGKGAGPGSAATDLKARETVGIGNAAVSKASPQDPQAVATRRDRARALIAIAIDQLASEPHDTIPGLKRRYYYRGSFVLLEHLSPRGLAVNVERLRHCGEREHAERLAVAWGAAP